LLLGLGPTLQNVHARAADDVAALLWSADRAGVNAGPHLELAADGVEIAAQAAGALGEHRALTRVEGRLGAVVVAAEIAEVAAVYAGLPPVEDRRALVVVENRLRRLAVAAVALVHKQTAADRHVLLEQPAVDRLVEPVLADIAAVLLGQLLGEVDHLVEGGRRL